MWFHSGVIVLILMLVATLVVGWSPKELPSNDHNAIARGDFVKQLACGIICTRLISVEPCHAVESRNDPGTSFESMLQKSLTPSTADTPQISLPNLSTDRASSRASKIPPPTIIQALVDLSNPQLRPLYTDVLVIQVYTAESEVLMGGAKIPMSKIRKFPVQLALTPENAIAKDSWIQASKQGDFIVKASICPEASWEDPQTLCGLSPTNKAFKPLYSFQGNGLSKLLTKLPGMDEGFVQSTGGIRAPTSLKLEPLSDDIQ